MGNKNDRKKIPIDYFIDQFDEIEKQSVDILNTAKRKDILFKNQDIKKIKEKLKAKNENGKIIYKFKDREFEPSITAIFHDNNSGFAKNLTTSLRCDSSNDLVNKVVWQRINVSSCLVLLTISDFKF
jgi:hypothetical protein